jgi:hypothetical protein
MSRLPGEPYPFRCDRELPAGDCPDPYSYTLASATAPYIYAATGVVLGAAVGKSVVKAVVLPTAAQLAHTGRSIGECVNTMREDFAQLLSEQVAREHAATKAAQSLAALDALEEGRIVENDGESFYEDATEQVTESTALFS